MNFIIRSSSIAVALLLLPACAGVSAKFSVYKSPNAAAQPERKVLAVMPLSVTSAMTTKAVGYGFLFATIYKRHTYSLPPGEYLPAEVMFENKIADAFRDVRLILPKEIEAAMSAAPAETFEEAVRLVPGKVDADGVLAFEMRDVVMKGPDFEGGSEARGITSLTLYDRSGEVVWSIAGNVRWVVGGQLSTQPTLAEFVEQALNEIRPKIEEVK